MGFRIVTKFKFSVLHPPNSCTPNHTFSIYWNEQLIISIVLIYVIFTGVDRLLIVIFTILKIINQNDSHAQHSFQNGIRIGEILTCN